MDFVEEKKKTLENLTLRLMTEEARLRGQECSEESSVTLFTGTRSRDSGRSKNDYQNKANSNRQLKKKNFGCYTCEKADHRRKDCPGCFTCGSKMHFKQNCPKEGKKTEMQRNAISSQQGASSSQQGATVRQSRD